MQVSEYRIVVEYDHAKSEWRVIVMEKDMDLGAFQVSDIMATQDDNLLRGMAVKGLLRAMPDHFLTPDLPEPEYDEKEAEEEGWQVVAREMGDVPHIVALHAKGDPRRIFDTHAEANRYVRRRAANGSYLHKQALAYIAHWTPKAEDAA